MFFLQRPAPHEIDRFLRGSMSAPYSYAPNGLVDTPAVGFTRDEVVAPIGHGRDDFDRACDALAAWQHFGLGWAELFPRQPSLASGTVVAVLVHHLGFWSLNGCRVQHVVDERAHGRFGFTYGTLTNHAESGEEVFEVLLDPSHDTVMYRIRAVSRPQAVLAQIGWPFARMLQARFRQHSIAAMRQAVAGRRVRQ